MKKRVLFALLVVSLLSGCAKSVVLSPGSVSFPAEDPPVTRGKWSLAVDQALDNRNENRDSMKIGTATSVTQGDPVALNMDLRPEKYVKEQLSRYLLYRKWEATSQKVAKVLVDVSLIDLDLIQQPAFPLNQLDCRVAYKLIFTAKDGSALGDVTLSANSTRKQVGGSPGDWERLVRETIEESFKGLDNSQLFQDILGR